MHTSELLDDLAGQALLFGSEVDGSHASRVPMALSALQGIGASDDRLSAFMLDYIKVKGLVPFGSAGEHFEPFDWFGSLGDRSQEPNLRLFFEKEIEARTVEVVLQEYLPLLAPGVAASAFYALMRLSYAVSRRRPKEIAAGLAFWSASFFPLPAASDNLPVGTLDPTEFLSSVADIASLRSIRSHGLIWMNIREVAADPDFASAIDRLAITKDAPAEMARSAIELFAATNNFCAYHAVTGGHWIRTLSPLTDRPDMMLRHFWQAVAAMLPEMGFPRMPTEAELAELRSIKAPSWDNIRQAAVASDSEHAAGLVYSAMAEEEAYGDPLYRVATARWLGLID